MRAGRAILDALGHRVWLVPHNVTAQIPAIILQGERQPPRNADQVLWLQALGRVGANVHRPGRVLLVRGAITAIAARVAVADVQPKGAVIRQHAPHLGEDGHQSVQELGHGALKPDLFFDAVIAQPPVGRRSDHTAHRPGRQTAQHSQGVPLKKRRAAQGERLGALDSLNARRRGGFGFWHVVMSSQSWRGCTTPQCL